MSVLTIQRKVEAIKSAKIFSVIAGFDEVEFFEGKRVIQQLYFTFLAIFFSVNHRDRMLLAAAPPVIDGANQEKEKAKFCQGDHGSIIVAGVGYS